MNDEHTRRDRRRFALALGLFLVWVAVLIGLGVKSGYRPMDRAGMAPSGIDDAQNVNE